MAGTSAPEGIINPPIDDLLDVVDSKYGLVIMASMRETNGRSLEA